MEAIDTTSVASTPTPVATPPATVPVVTTAPTTIDTTSQSSGSGSSIVQTLKNLNWVEVGFGILGAAALYYAIYYYKYSIKTAKTFETDFQNKIDDINIKIADVSSSISELQTRDNETTSSSTPQNF
jgi:peptidoglycan hydrolase CwlO-like protein